MSDRKQLLMTYLRYIGPALWTWLLGISWCFTRDTDEAWYETGFDENAVPSIYGHPRYGELPASMMIHYKPGWGPWKFLPVYLTTYLAGVVLGYGCVSLSRAWYERSQWHDIPNMPKSLLMSEWPPYYPFAFYMTRLLNWAFPGSRHGRETGPRLWGVEGIRR